MNRDDFVWMVFSALAVEAVFSIVFLNWQLAAGSVRAGAVCLILVVTSAACGTIWRWKKRWSSILCSLAKPLESLQTPRWIGFCFVVGTVLRLLWVWAYPAPQTSDHATYFQLARLAFESHHYGFPGGGMAYWPPGYPFFLAAWFFFLGAHAWIPLAANLALFGGTLIIVERLGSRIAGAIAGKVSAVLLVGWPTLVMTAGLASKEMLVLFLLSSSLLTFAIALDSTSSAGIPGMLILSGLLLGYASLTQPSVLTFPGVLLIYIWLRKRAYFRGFGYVLLTSLVLLSVILPWMLRNHRVLGAWVPVATNGGDVFYRANNPLATGGYTLQGEQSLDSYEEVTRNKIGFQLGKDWIRAHPAQFLILAIRKQVLFLGDDGQGAFETLKRGLGIGGLTYVFWKGVCNAYWMVLWLLILVAMATHWKDSLSNSQLLATVALSIIYLYAIHSVFESGAKYHQPLAVFIAVSAAQAFVPRSGTGESD
jgi:4-amino-4-deoxy-L-arabinose transferase-like glycosyltransferase